MLPGVVAPFSGAESGVRLAAWLTAQKPEGGVEPAAGREDCQGKVSTKWARCDSHTSLSGNELASSQPQLDVRLETNFERWKHYIMTKSLFVMVCTA